MDFFSKSLNEIDKEISLAIDKELSRQQNQIELISQLEKILKDDSSDLQSYLSILNSSDSFDYSIINREVQNNNFQFFFKSLLFYLFAFSTVLVFNTDATQYECGRLAAVHGTTHVCKTCHCVA